MRLVGCATYVKTGLTFNTWSYGPTSHGWADLIGFKTMLKLGKEYNPNITLLDNGYIEVSTCGQYKTTVRLLKGNHKL